MASAQRLLIPTWFGAVGKFINIVVVEVSEKVDNWYPRRAARGSHDAFRLGVSHASDQQPDKHEHGRLERGPCIYGCADVG